MLIVKIGVDGLDGKLSVGEGTRLVEDGRIDLGKDVHIVGPLDEDTLARGSSDTSEEGEGNADDQGTRAADHEEHQGAIEPRGEGTTSQGGDDGQGDGCKHDHRRIDAGKARDEGFATRFVVAGVLDE